MAREFKRPLTRLGKMISIKAIEEDKSLKEVSELLGFKQQSGLTQVVRGYMAPGKYTESIAEYLGIEKSEVKEAHVDQDRLIAV